MIYLNQNMEITDNNNARYQVHIPRSEHSIPKGYINVLDKRATKTVEKKVLEALVNQGIDITNYNI